MRKVSTIHTISGIVLAFGLIVSSLIYVPSLATTAVAEETSPIHTPLTAQTAHDISTGRIRLENNQIDSLLYHKAALDPDQDSDGDGLKNSEELYTYVKNGRTYYGYNSHPLIKDTDGDGLDDKTITILAGGILAPETWLFLWSLCIGKTATSKKYLTTQNRSLKFTKIATNTSLCITSLRHSGKSKKHTTLEADLMLFFLKM